MIEKLFVTKTSNTLIQLFRYTFVGGAAFIVDFISLFAFTEYVKLYYLISAAIAFMLGLTTNYILSTAWVFNTHRLTNRHFEFIVFASIGIVGLGLNELAIWFFTEKLALYYMLSKIIATIFTYMWNFFARKYILYNTQRSGENN